MEPKTWEEIKAVRGAPENTPEYVREGWAIQFGELVRQFRQEAGITQQTLAKRMGTTQSSVARVEAGSSVPTVETLGRLAQALGRGFVVRVEPNGGPTAAVSILRLAGAKSETFAFQMGPVDTEQEQKSQELWLQH